MASSSSPRILVSGAGVGGLTLAIALAKRGVAPVLVDAAKSSKQFADQAGVLLPPRAMQLLDELGVGDDVRQAGQPLHTYAASDSAFRPYGKLQFERLEMPSPVGISKDKLLGALEKHLSAGADVRRNCALLKVSMTHSGKFKGSFAQGGLGAPKQAFDVLVGADGPASVVRNAFFKSAEVDIKPAGYSAWSVTMERPASIDPSTFTEMWGEGRRIFLFPVDPEGKRICVWGTLPTKFLMNQQKPGAHSTRSGALFRDEFAPFFVGGGLRAVWKALEAPYAPKASVIQPPLVMTQNKSHSTFPVALVGDAAHCVPPTFIGNGGAGLAIEDAVKLADALVADDLATALKGYGNDMGREKFILKEAKRQDVSSLTTGKFRLSLRHTVLKWQKSNRGLLSAFRRAATKQ